MNNKNFKVLKKNARKAKYLKIKFMLVSIFNAKNKTRYLKKNKVFAEMGENVLFQPMKLPNNPDLIKIHNNVKIAADVTFYEHDVINQMLSIMDDTQYMVHHSCIEIFDNVFIGGNSVIIGNCKIGPNAVIGAGSVVTKDVPPGTIVAGNPATVVGKFEDLHNRRKKEMQKDGDSKMHISHEELWKEFDKKRR